VGSYRRLEYEGFEYVGNGGVAELVWVPVIGREPAVPSARSKSGHVRDAQTTGDLRGVDHGIHVASNSLWGREGRDDGPVGESREQLLKCSRSLISEMSFDEIGGAISSVIISPLGAGGRPSQAGICWLRTSAMRAPVSERFTMST
jgi:hypothetical protein